MELFYTDAVELIQEKWVSEVKIKWNKKTEMLRTAARNNDMDMYNGKTKTGFSWNSNNGNVEAEEFLSEHGFFDGEEVNWISNGIGGTKNQFKFGDKFILKNTHDRFIFFDK
jgi:hypothetical protein